MENIQKCEILFGILAGSLVVYCVSQRCGSLWRPSSQLVVLRTNWALSSPARVWKTKWNTGSDFKLLQYFQILVLSLFETISWHSGRESCRAPVPAVFWSTELVFQAPSKKLRNGPHENGKVKQRALTCSGSEPTCFLSPVQFARVFEPFKSSTKVFCSCRQARRPKKTHWCTIRWTHRPGHKILYRWILTHQSFLYSILSLEWVISKISDWR